MTNNQNKCICPKTCDCQDPNGGSKSNNCPIHNEDPDPDPKCEAPLHLNSLTDHLAGTYAELCGVTCHNTPMTNSYVWSGSGTADITVYFAPDETLHLTYYRAFDPAAFDPVPHYKFELADPQLENKLKSLIDNIHNAS